ncbi:hypothetical protein GCM10020370_49930 [Paenibacillus hodogayensis]
MTLWDVPGTITVSKAELPSHTCGGTRMSGTQWVVLVVFIIATVIFSWIMSSKWSSKWKK